MKVYVSERVRVTRALCQVIVEYYFQFFFSSSLYASFYAKASFPLMLSFFATVLNTFNDIPTYKMEYFFY